MPAKPTPPAPILAEDTTVSPIVVVTADTAEQWAALCEETEQADFCDWAIHGFTTNGWFDFKSYLLEIERYIGALEANDAYFRNVLDRLGEGIEQDNE